MIHPLSTAARAREEYFCTLYERITAVGYGGGAQNRRGGGGGGGIKVGSSSEEGMANSGDYRGLGRLQGQGALQL